METEELGNAGTDPIVMIGYVCALRQTVSDRIAIRGIGERLPDHYQFDTERMRAGGVDAVMLSVAATGPPGVPDEATSPVFEYMEELLALIESHRDIVGLARDAGEVRDLRAQGRLAIVAHMTGTASLGGEVGRLERLYELGLRSLHFSPDAAGEAGGTWGLTPFGRRLIAEMDRLWMPVDLSHISDRAFWEALEVCEGQVYASHSNCRELCAVARNLTDEMIAALAERDGVIGTHFAGHFCDEEFGAAMAEARDRYLADVYRLAEDLRRRFPDPLDYQRAFFDPGINPGFAPDYHDRFGFPAAPPLQRMVDHIDHICELVGPRHVAIGSDFNGISRPMIVRGLEDISKTPAIADELRRRGYAEADIRAIMGENWLRLLA